MYGIFKKGTSTTLVCNYTEKNNGLCGCYGRDNNCENKVCTVQRKVEQGFRDRTAKRLIEEKQIIECFDCYKNITESDWNWPVYSGFEDYRCNECHIFNTMPPKENKCLVCDCEMSNNKFNECYRCFNRYFEGLIAVERRFVA